MSFPLDPLPTHNTFLAGRSHQLHGIISVGELKGIQNHLLVNQKPTDHSNHSNHSSPLDPCCFFYYKPPFLFVALSLILPWWSKSHKTHHFEMVKLPTFHHSSW